MKSIADLLDDLHIDKEPVLNENGSWTIDLDNSNEWGRYYSRLEKSGDFEQDDESSTLNSIQYAGEDYTITLLGDIDTDEYKIVIRENGKI